MKRGSAAAGKVTSAKSAPVKPSRKYRGGSKNRLKLVRGLITTWSEQLENDKSKSGVAELIRLLALEKELTPSDEAVREIKVTWVEPKETA